MVVASAPVLWLAGYFAGKAFAYLGHEPAQVELERRFEANVVLWGSEGKPKDWDSDEPGAYVDLHKVPGRVERVGDVDPEDRVPHLADHALAFESGQPLLQAIVIPGEPLVIEAKKMQDGRMKVVSCDDILLGAKPKLVSRAVAATRLNSSAGQPTGEAKRVMIASVSACLKHGHPAKLRRKDDQS